LKLGASAGYAYMFMGQDNQDTSIYPPGRWKGGKATELMRGFPGLELELKPFTAGEWG